MPYLKSLDREAKLLDVFRMLPELWRPIIEFHELLMRGPSSLSNAERELIAAYVSAHNECRYCHGVHAATAERFGIEPGLLAGLIEDIDSSKIDSRMKPVLMYAKKLTVSPNHVTAEDVAEMQRLGWDDVAIHHVASICALFNFMNRMVDGLGIQGDDEYFKSSSERLHLAGYGQLLRRLSSS